MTQLNLQTVLPPQSSLTVFDTLESDGNFLIVHSLVSTLTAGQPVTLVTLSQIFNHYVLAAKKWGCNLTSSKDSGQLKVIDAITNLQGWNQPGDETQGFSLSPNPSIKPCQTLYNQIRSSLEGTKAPMVAIDDLSALYFSGIPTNEILIFLDYLQALVTKAQGTLVFLAHSDDDLEDEEYVHFIKTLSYRATCIVKISQLESGHSRDVDGEIAILRGLQHWNPAAKAPENTAFHFKLADNSVKLFAKGLSAGFV